MLILGTLPSVRSLEAQAYYAHPRNSFWWIMSQLLGFDPGLDYLARKSCVRANGIAIWDVISSCVRPGSLDSSIQQDTLVANDFAALTQRHPELRCIAFNGQPARKLFRKHVESIQALPLDKIDLLMMPSTSPAHAAMSWEDKMQRWSAILKYLGN